MIFELGKYMMGCDLCHESDHEVIYDGCIRVGVVGIETNYRSR